MIELVSAAGQPIVDKVIGAVSGSETDGGQTGGLGSFAMPPTIRRQMHQIDLTEYVGSRPLYVPYTVTVNTYTSNGGTSTACRLRMIQPGIAVTGSCDGATVNGSTAWPGSAGASTAGDLGEAATDYVDDSTLQVRELAFAMPTANGAKVTVNIAPFVWTALANGYSTLWFQVKKSSESDPGHWFLYSRDSIVPNTRPEFTVNHVASPIGDWLAGPPRLGMSGPDWQNIVVPLGYRDFQANDRLRIQAANVNFGEDVRVTDWRAPPGTGRGQERKALLFELEDLALHGHYTYFVEVSINGGASELDFVGVNELWEFKCDPPPGTPVEFLLTTDPHPRRAYKTVNNNVEVHPYDPSTQGRIWRRTHDNMLEREAADGLLPRMHIDIGDGVGFSETAPGTPNFFPCTRYGKAGASANRDYPLSQADAQAVVRANILDMAGFPFPFVRYLYVPGNRDNQWHWMYAANNALGIDAAKWIRDELIAQLDIPHDLPPSYSAAMPYWSNDPEARWFAHAIGNCLILVLDSYATTPYTGSLTNPLPAQPVNAADWALDKNQLAFIKAAVIWFKSAGRRIGLKWVVPVYHNQFGGANSYARGGKTYAIDGNAPAQKLIYDLLAAEVGPHFVDCNKGHDHEHHHETQGSDGIHVTTLLTPSEYNSHLGSLQDYPFDKRKLGAGHYHATAGAATYVKQLIGSYVAGTGAPPVPYQNKDILWSMTLTAPTSL